MVGIYDVSIYITLLLENLQLILNVTEIDVAFSFSLYRIFINIFTALNCIDIYAT